MKATQLPPPSRGRVSLKYGFKKTISMGTIEPTLRGKGIEGMKGDSENMAKKLGTTPN
jgi:hypothetical protein